MEDLSQHTGEMKTDFKPIEATPASAPETVKPEKKSFRSTNPDLTIRPAKASELPLVHERLGEAVDTTSEYTERFREYEKSRLNLTYLRNLHAVDPHHIFMLENKGQVVGFMLSGPEFGTLWLYWSYVFPEFRRASLAMSFLPMFCEYWDNRRFHKISTYTLPENKIAVALMKRFKFGLTCTLKNHLFGQDFLLWERPLTKSEDGYDNGINVGTRGRIMRQIRGWLGL